MSHLIDQLELKNISLPGTHDSGTFGNIVNWPIDAAVADCQVWSLAVQLKVGIRYFDWRLYLDDNGGIYIHHGIVHYDVSWTSILDTTTEFLSNHKSETLIFRLGFTDISAGLFNTIMAPYVNARKIVFFQEDRIPQLIHVRGQIIILVGDNSVVNGMILAPGDNDFLMNSNMAIEDIYEGALTTDTKIEFTRGDRGMNGPTVDPRRWHISYSSFTSGGNPEDLADYINPRINAAVEGYANGKNMGVLVMDFPGDTLIGGIINSNTGLATIAQCCFYTEINYGGTSFCIQSDTAYVGDALNDQFSSWQCSDGRYAILYKDKNYGGDKYLTECRGKELSNANWDNQISSIKLKYCDQDYQYSTKYCSFFVDKGWEGESVSYSSNQQSVALNDKFSSWDCNPGMGAILYQDINYGGSSSTVSCGTRQSDASQISFEDKISSVKVYKCPYCCFYTEDNYLGNYFCTANDILKLSPVFNATITSWRCTTNAYATLTLADSSTYQTSCGENTVHNVKAIIKIQLHTCSGWSAMIEEELAETSSGVHASSRFGRLLLPWQIGLIVAALSTIFISIIVVIFLWKRKQQSTMMSDDTVYVDLTK